MLGILIISIYHSLNHLINFKIKARELLRKQNEANIAKKKKKETEKLEAERKEADRAQLEKEDERLRDLDLNLWN